MRVAYISFFVLYPFSINHFQHLIIAETIAETIGHLPPANPGIHSGILSSAQSCLMQNSNRRLVKQQNRNVLKFRASRMPYFALFPGVICLENFALVCGMHSFHQLFRKLLSRKSGKFLLVLKGLKVKSIKGGCSKESRGSRLFSR